MKTRSDEIRGNTAIETLIAAAADSAVAIRFPQEGDDELFVALKSAAKAAGLETAQGRFEKWPVAVSNDGQIVQGGSCTWRDDPVWLVVGREAGVRYRSGGEECLSCQGQGKTLWERLIAAPARG